MEKVTPGASAIPFWVVIAVLTYSLIYMMLMMLGFYWKDIGAAQVAPPSSSSSPLPSPVAHIKTTEELKTGEASKSRQSEEASTMSETTLDNKEEQNNKVEEEPKKEVESEDLKEEESTVEEQPKEVEREQPKEVVEEVKTTESKTTLKAPTIFKLQCNVQEKTLTELARIAFVLLKHERIAELSKASIRETVEKNVKELRTAKSGPLLLACLPLAPILICGNDAQLVELAISLNSLTSTYKITPNMFLELFKLIRQELLEDKQVMYYQNDSLPDLATMIRAYKSKTLDELDPAVIDSVGQLVYGFFQDLSGTKDSALEPYKQRLSEIYNSVV